MKNSLPSICFVSPNAYGCLAKTGTGLIGGAERQVSLLAKWLANRGYAVSVLTWDEGQPDGIVIDGVRVFTICGRNEGAWGVRFFCPKWTGLVRALRRADAGIYYQSCGECVTGQVALWCRQNRRRFIYANVSDADCTVGLPRIRSVRERILYRYGLSRADLVVAQTQTQHKMLKKGFGRESVVIPMPCPGPSESEYSRLPNRQVNSARVLWVGRLCRVKRPDLLLELARMCSDLQFDMVGPVAEDEYALKVVRHAQSIENVTKHGRVTDGFLRGLYAKSSVFCSTSDVEGFPNTFLEAWSYGLPIVSTFDPDNLINEKGLGRVGKDVSELAAGIRELLDSPEQWNNASMLSREYYLEKHSMEKAMQRFEQVLLDEVNSGR